AGRRWCRRPVERWRRPGGSRPSRSPTCGPSRWPRRRPPDLPVCGRRHRLVCGSMRSVRSVAVLGAVMVAILVPASRAGAAVIEVFPGPGALQNAIDTAGPGDTLSIHTGTYHESVSIGTRNLTLRPFGDGPVTVDAGCAVFATIRV